MNEDFLLELLVFVKLLKYGMSQLSLHVRSFFVAGHCGALVWHREM